MVIQLCIGVFKYSDKLYNTEPIAWCCYEQAIAARLMFANAQTHTSRSLYSLLRRACVTPSRASTKGQARSYVGYACAHGSLHGCVDLLR